MHPFVMEINGLPLHILVIHAAVVFGPLAALAGIAYVALPGWRDRLRWVTLALALVAVGAAWLAYFTGKDFLDSPRFAFLDDPNANAAIVKGIQDHEQLGEVLPWVVSGFGLAVVAATLLHARTGPVRVVLSVLVIAGAVATLVYSFLTGEAGSQAVWGS